MNSSLLMFFGRMCPDFVLPALVESAEGDVASAESSLDQTTPSAPLAAAQSFADEFYQRIAAQTSSRLFPRLGSSGWMERGRFSTLDGLVSHSADSAYSVCSLSETLERSVAAKYFLSPRACQGILRRAAKRGRELPPALQAALEAVAQSAPSREEDGEATA